MVRKHKGKSAKNAARGRLGPGTSKFRRKKGKHQDEGDALDQQERNLQKIQKAATAAQSEEELMKQPHSFVIHRGQVGKYVKALESDLRRIMEPNTAKNLKILKRNNLKDFVVNGAVLGVTNMMVLTVGDSSLQLRMIRFSQGPTLTFRVKQYSLSRHILSTQKRPLIHEKIFATAPLVIMNGFNQAGQKQLQLVQTYIRNMFPSINIDTVDLRGVKRCLIISYNEDDDTIDLRQYSIRIVATGLNKSVKKLIQADHSSTKALPDLSRYADITEFILNPGQLSDSEFEGEQQELELPMDISKSKGIVKGSKSSVRLIEIGPRINMELLKIEEGIDEGEVLYHKYIQKSSEEIVETRKQLPKLKKVKKRAQQEREQCVIRRLTVAKEAREREEAEIKALTESAARKQAAAIGQTEDIENEREKDREIAINREREKKRGGGEGQNQQIEPDKKKRKLNNEDKDCKEKKRNKKIGANRSSKRRN